MAVKKSGVSREKSGGKTRVWFVLLIFFSCLLSPNSQLVFGTVRQEVYVTGHVQPFGGYIFTEAVTFEITEPGKQEIGQIVVDGLYNGEYPWIMRCYTDNLHFTGVGGALRSPPPAGMVSEDGKFVIPLFINTPIFGADEWRRIPDVSEPEFVPYKPDPEPGKTDYTDCVMIGIDPRNGSWVAGPDGLLYTGDDNILGDGTVETPFEMTLQADVLKAAVRGKYAATLYIEIVSAP